MASEVLGSFYHVADVEKYFHEMAKQILSQLRRLHLSIEQEWQFSAHPKPSAGIHEPGRSLLVDTYKSFILSGIQYTSGRGSQKK
jgi:hypothetical protein